MTSPYIGKGLALMARVRRRVRVVSRVSAIKVEGGKSIEQVAFWRGSASGDRVAADVLLLHQGVVPNVNLAMSAGVTHGWSDRQLCFLPEVDPWGGTGIDGIAVAGDGAGIAGAEAAVERGRLAGTNRDRKRRFGQAVGQKCPRCWTWNPDIGLDEHFGDVCPRCARVLKESGM